MRKMFTVGLAAVMAMGLCACGSQKAPETTAAPRSGSDHNSRGFGGRKGRDHRGPGIIRDSRR